MATVSSVESEEAAGEPVPRVTVHVDIEQIVAMNIRYWRRCAGMTQEGLGELLGWSAANVSAAERSADEKRERRRFDAGTLTGLSLALGVPLIALFFPPEDDSPGRRYVFPALPGDPEGDTELDMTDLLGFVLMPDSSNDTDIMAAYRHRFTTAVDTYLDSRWGREVARWLAFTEDAEMRAVRAARLRSRQAEMLRAAAEFGDMADVIDPAGGTDGG